MSKDLKQDFSSECVPKKLLSYLSKSTFQKILSGMPSEWQTVWIKIRPDKMSGLTCIQIVSKSYQQTTQGNKHFKKTTWNSFLSRTVTMQGLTLLSLLQRKALQCKLLTDEKRRKFDKPCLKQVCQKTAYYIM